MVTNHVAIMSTVADSMLWLKTRQMHSLQQACGEKGTGRDSLKLRVLRPLSRGESARPLPGQAFIVFLRSYIKEGFIIYYIEYCCLHFRYNQRNENNKCRRERGRADYAPSLGKFTQALESTLKTGNKHVLFQTRARES